MSEAMERIKADLESTRCTDAMQDFFRVGDVRALVAEVERLREHIKHSAGLVMDQGKEISQLRAAIERVRVLALNPMQIVDGSQRIGPAVIPTEILAALEADR